MPGRVHLCFAIVWVQLWTTVAFGLDALHVRDGWPHVAARSTSGELRVAYLGGSITAAEGWRTLTTGRLRELLADTKIVEIAAGLPGTGSDLGGCRIERDVLRHRPDVVFVEFAVNDATTPPGQIERTIEGIVRQVKRADADTDLCFVYTLSTPGLADLQAGRLPRAAAAMEAIAAHYGIPSLHFGPEIVRRIAAGALVFQGDTDDGDRAFSLDGVHPTAAGHRVCFEQLAAALPALLATKNTPRPLPPPLHPENWEHATLREIDRATLRGDWAVVAPGDPNLHGVTKALLPPTWRTATSGAALECGFAGTHFGLLGIAAPDSGGFVVTIDDLPPERATFFDAYASPTFCRQTKWFFPHVLAPGRHHVRVELSAEPLDKAAIKARAKKVLAPPEAYAPQRLTLSALLIVDTAVR